MYQLTGYKPEELIGQPSALLMPDAAIWDVQNNPMVRTQEIKLEMPGRPEPLDFVPLLSIARRCRPNRKMADRCLG